MLTGQTQTLNAATTCAQLHSRSHINIYIVYSILASPGHAPEVNSLCCHLGVVMHYLRATTTPNLFSLQGVVFILHITLSTGILLLFIQVLGSLAWLYVV